MGMTTADEAAADAEFGARHGPVAGATLLLRWTFARVLAGPASRPSRSP